MGLLARTGDVVEHKKRIEVNKENLVMLGLCLPGFSIAFIQEHFTSKVDKCQLKCYDAIGTKISSILELWDQK